MNKNYIVTIGAVAFATLFYQQQMGLNLLIFSLILVAFTICEYKPKLTNTNFWFSVAACLITGFSTAWFGDAVSVIANIMSLLFLALFAQHQNSSIFLGLTQGIFNFITSSIHIVIRIFNKKRTPSNEKKSNNFIIKALAMVIVPVAILLIFMRLYMAANPIFEQKVASLNLDFISIGFILFTLWGAFMVFTFMSFRKESAFSNIDSIFKENLDSKIPTSTFRNLSIKQEILSGTVLFGLLNFLLVTVLFVDFQYLILDASLPEDITYSEFVHQGIGAVITSIVFAVLLIVFYFKGSLNFSRKANLLKNLSIVWIILNVLLLVSASIKNDMYINEYGLTLKRIGVYIYLLLAFIGLSITLVKIICRKSNWFLVKKGYWAFFFVLVLSTPVNWSKIITDYNINRYNEDGARLDIDYLLKLSEHNVVALLPLAELNVDSVSKKYYYDSNSRPFKQKLGEKLYKFVAKHRNKNFRSITFYDQRNLKILENSKPLFETLDLGNCSIGNKLEFINLFADIKKLDLSGLQYFEMEEFDWRNLEKYSKLEDLNIAHNFITDNGKIKFPNSLTILNMYFCHLNNLNGITDLTNLESLNLGRNGIKELNGIESLTNLENLNIESNNLSRLNGLESLYNLKFLNISDNNKIEYIYELQNLYNLERVGLDCDYIKDYSPLYNLKKLKYVNVTYMNESSINKLKRNFGRNVTVD